MEQNYGMIQNWEHQALSAESALRSAESALALVRWIQRVAGIDRREALQLVRHAADRAQMELRLYALFAD
jgi:hypothetical protein